MEIAQPLFIYAATICRWIRDTRLGDPKDLLTEILTYQSTSQTLKPESVYLPVLNRSFMNLPVLEKDKLIIQFKRVIETIVILNDPLPMKSIARLLFLSSRSLRYSLGSLHSILSIPTDINSPVRFLNLSFRDFLLDDEQRDRSPFWVDKGLAHKDLAICGIRVMSEQLCENMCNLQNGGILRRQVDTSLIDSRLSSELQYSCRYWVDHFKQSSSTMYQ